LATEPVSESLSLLGGKLTYLWWSATGDDFNSGPKFGEKVLGLLNGIHQDPELVALAAEIREAVKNEYFVSSYASKKYINIKWSSLRALTDKFDYRILELLGLTEEWRGLNIWHRQAMKSSGDNPSSSPIAGAEVERLGEWYKQNLLS
jgi:hypothetical protein